MRVPRPISAVWGAEILICRQSSCSNAKIVVSGIFAHDQVAPTEGRRAFFPAGGRAIFGPRKSRPEAGDFKKS